MADAITQGPSTRRTGMSQALIILFAVSCGVSVANLYYAQPVLHDIAKSFGTSSGTAGLVVTFAQIGYAAGLALLVPLGDLLRRRWLVPSVLLVTAAGLVVSAAAPDIGVLVAVGLIVGAGSVAAQILVPMAASLADEEHRGHVVGVVMSGLLLGILLARTVSGIVAQVSSWRVVYVMAAGMTALLAVVLARRLPGEGERPRIGYGTLLRSAARLLATESRPPAPGPVRGTGLRRLQCLLDHHGLPPVRGPVPLRRPDHRAVRAGGGERRADRQLRRPLGRPGLDPDHHPGLRRADAGVLPAAVVGAPRPGHAHRGDPAPRRRGAGPPGDQPIPYLPPGP